MKNPDHVLVQPVQPYMEGNEHKNARSKPYGVPRWQAEELKALGFATIVEEPKPAPSEPVKPATPPTTPPGEEEEPEVERPDDNSGALGARTAPVAAAQGGPVSSVPARPGDQPVTPTAPVKRATRRGRPAAKRA